MDVSGSGAAWSPVSSGHTRCSSAAALSMDRGQLVDSAHSNESSYWRGCSPFAPAVVGASACFRQDASETQFTFIFEVIRPS